MKNRPTRPLLSSDSPPRRGLPQGIAILVLLALVARFGPASPALAQEVPVRIADFHVDAVGRAVVRVPFAAGSYFVLCRGELNPADAVLDPDTGGRSNLQEYRDGTPLSVANVPPPPAAPRVLLTIKRKNMGEKFAE